LDNAGYLSEQEKADFDFKVDKVEINLIEICEHLRILVDQVGENYPELALRLG